MDIQDFYDLGLNVSGGGKMLAPTLRKSDFAYSDAQGDRIIEQYLGGGGDNGYDLAKVLNPAYRAAGYYLTPEAQARLGQWTKDNATSIAWGGDTDIGGLMGGDSMGRSFSDFFNFGERSDAPRGQQLSVHPLTGELGYYAGGGDNQTFIPVGDGAQDRAALDKAFSDFWSQDGISANVKTADKEATGVKWVRQGDSFVPVSTTGSFGVNTNNNHTVPALAFAALAGGGLAANAAMTGSAFTAAAEGAAGAGGLFGGAGTAGSGIVESIGAADGLANAGWGLEAANSGLGVGGMAGGAWSAPGLTSAATAAGAALPAVTNIADVVASGAAPTSVSAPSGGGAPGGSGLPSIPGLDSLPDWLKALGPDVLKAIPGLVTGRMDDRQQRINAQDYRDLATNTAGQLRGAADTFAGKLGGLFDKYKGAYDPFYATVNNGIATSSIDPLTGKVGFNLNAPYAAERDRLFGQAAGVAQQIGSADPRAHAAERFNAAKALYAPGDAAQQQSLMQDLFTKGGFGLTTNTPAAASADAQGNVLPGQGSVGVNPYLATFLNSQNQRDANLGYNSLREGESYLNNLIGRQSGLFNAAQGIDTAGAGVVNQALSTSGQLMRDRQGAAQFGYGAEREAAQIPYNAERDYIQALFGANSRFMAGEASADQAKQNNYWDAARSIDWGSIWKSITGGK
jgi:hypothetical protein